MNKVEAFFRSTGMIIFAVFFCLVMFVICIFSKIFRKHTRKNKSVGE